MSTERTIQLPTSSAPSSGSEVFDVDGQQYRFSYTVERIDKTSPADTCARREEVQTAYNRLLNKVPVLRKLETEVDPDNPNIKYYVYEKRYNVATNRGPETRTQIIRRRYETHTTVSPRDTATDDVIQCIKEMNLPNLSVLHIWQHYYIPIMTEKYPKVLAYSYAAFMKRWRDLLAAEETTPATPPNTPRESETESSEESSN